MGFYNKTRAVLRVLRARRKKLARSPLQGTRAMADGALVFGSEPGERDNSINKAKESHLAGVETVCALILVDHDRHRDHACPKPRQLENRFCTWNEQA